MYNIPHVLCVLSDDAVVIVLINFCGSCLFVVFPLITPTMCYVYIQIWREKYTIIHVCTSLVDNCDKRDSAVLAILRLID